MIADPHLSERGITTTVEHSVLGPVRALSSPLRLSKTPPQISALQAAGAVYDPALAKPAGGADV
jgi:crotonobetainyl-CoA:carnitine CoA-transferase CaiB-like acyl-CoA transferase